MIEKYTTGQYFMRIALIMAFLCLCAGGCSYVNKKLGLNDDNPIEQFVEDQIYDQTGFQIDLTPQFYFLEKGE